MHFAQGRTKTHQPMAQAKNNGSNLQKVLIGVVIILGAILIALVGWQTLYAESGYSAVYLRTGDLYFGKLTKFPYFGLKNVYLLQATADPANPLRIQKFSQVFWGPQDFLKLNRDEVVWYTKLDPKSQLSELLKTNPELTAQETPQPQVQQQLPTQEPIEEEEEIIEE